MSIFIRGARAEPRRFSYDPRHYDPRKEEDLRQRLRIKSKTRNRRRNPHGIILFLMLFAMLVFVYVQLG